MRNDKTILKFHPGRLVLALCLTLPAATAWSADAKTVLAARAPATPQPLSLSAHSEVMPPLNVVIGKSTLIRLPAPVSRMSVGNPVVADVNLLNPRELYLLGKEIGSTNLIVWYRSGGTSVMDINVNIDTATLESGLRQLMPGEKDIHVSTAADSIVLQGTVSDVVKVDQAVSIAEAYVRKLNRSLVTDVKMPGSDQVANISLAGASGGGGRVQAAGARIINMLKVRDPQQVMLEVKVAEVSKSLLDKLGAEFNMRSAQGGWTAGILSSFLTGSGGLLSGSRGALKALNIDAEKQDGVIKILAEPNIMAISGQTGKFLAGGRIFIPVASSNSSGIPIITLEEKDFGVRVAFTPTVLEGGRIHLKVAPEVSELSQTGTPFTTLGGATAVLPSFTVRNAETTVQLNDGQSFAIAGLLRNNVTETVKRFPVLGEVPILGALFRSSEFQNDRTELLFVVTPRLVKPLPPGYALPTDHYHMPGRAGYFLGGQMEGSAPDSDASAPATPPAPTVKPQPGGGFEMR